MYAIQNVVTQEFIGFGKTPVTEWPDAQKFEDLDAAERFVRDELGPNTEMFEVVS